MHRAPWRAEVEVKWTVARSGNRHSKENPVHGIFEEGQRQQGYVSAQESFVFIPLFSIIFYKQQPVFHEDRSVNEFSSFEGKSGAEKKMWLVIMLVIFLHNNAYTNGAPQQCETLDFRPKLDNCSNVISGNTSNKDVFHKIFGNLTQDCKCELVSNIMAHFNDSELSEECKQVSVQSRLKNIYEENCGKQYLALYIVLPIVVLVLIVGVVALYMWKRIRSSANLQNKEAADKSPAHSQRYISTTMEGTATASNPGPRQDYENVFVGHLQTTEAKSYGYSEKGHQASSYSSKHAAEEDIYLESDINEGDQPIYTNTQGIYYNYSQPSFMKSKSKEEDDVYILPDQ
ncbi:protein GAPT [Leptodactylus fuscus]|uniref:uncharacterized protein LOC142189620 n=1 Tax=Leptodactylus fuscus TaxID=238119 RepID=UPI003F4E9FEE